MNRLDIELEHEQSPIAGISVYADLLVDDIPMGCCLAIDVFFHALKEDGRHPLFTCGCGVFECGGHYVDVESTESEWTIKNLYHPRSRALEKNSNTGSSGSLSMRWQQRFKITSPNSAEAIPVRLSDVGEVHPAT